MKQTTDAETMCFGAATWNFTSKKMLREFVIILSVIAIFGGVATFAAPPAPTPTCRIEGVIQSVDFKDSYDEACLKEPYGCPTDMELYHPARYFLNVSINLVTYISGTTDFNTCERMYPVGSVQTIFINKDKVKPNDTFAVNQKIEGIVRSFWGESFDSYILEQKPAKPQK